MNQEDMEEEITLYYQEIDYYTEFYYMDIIFKEVQDYLDYYDYMIRSNLFNEEELNITADNIKMCLSKLNFVCYFKGMYFPPNQN